MHRAVSKLSDSVQLVGVVGARRASAQRLSLQHDIPALTPEDDWFTLHPDLIVVASPHSEHVKAIEMALEHGCDVICDKPIVLSESQWRHVADLATKESRRVFCTFVQRCSPGVLECRDFVRANMDDLRTINIRQVLHRPDSYYGTWKGSRSRAGGGVVMNQAIHAVDLVGFLIGHPLHVTGAIASARPNVQVETTALATFDYQGGHGHLVATTDASRDEKQVVALHFDSFSVCIVGNEVVHWAVVPSQDDSHSMEETVSRLAKAGDAYGPGYDAAVGDVLQALGGGGSSIYELDLPGVSAAHQFVFDFYTLAGV